MAYLLRIISNWKGTCKGKFWDIWSFAGVTDLVSVKISNLASRKEMDYIVTRNIKDYQNGGIKII